jgi:hypothetical protein
LAHLLKITAGLIIFGSTLVPTALAQGIMGITLKTAPNAVGIEWRSPAGMNAASYKVYFGKKSILQNNGKFDGVEQTIGNETSLTLLDLKNRGFAAGDMIFITVTAIDAAGNEQRIFAEEKSTPVQIAGTMGAVAPSPQPQPTRPAKLPEGERSGEPLPVLEPLPLPPAPVPLPTPQADTTPPVDARNLMLTHTPQNDGNYTVRASWGASPDATKDLASYNLYESKTRGRTFVGPTALKATVTSTTIANVPPGPLTVKLTTMDRAGNESQGIEETIVLTETGPGLVLLMSGMGAWVIARRRRAS